MAARCRSSSSRRRTSRGRTLGGDATVACGRCLRNPSLSRLILATAAVHKAAALEAAAHKAAALEAAVLSRQSRTRGVGGMRKAAVLEAAALEAAALERGGGALRKRKCIRTRWW